MKRFCSIALLIVSFSNLACHRTVSDDVRLNDSQVSVEQGLEAKIGELARSLETVPQTGLSVGVVRRDKVLALWHGGLEDREAALPVKPETLFAIGSVTKTFTSFAVAEQVDQGKLDLDVPVRTYLPMFQLASDEVSAQATLRDLLSHRVGLPRHDLMWYATPFTSASLVERLRYLDMNPKPEMGFRKAFQYNNLMFLVAGQILEQVTGRSWANIVERDILAPVGMAATHTSNETLEPGDTIAAGYAKSDLLPFHPITSVASAGSILSNASDMARWIQVILREGVSPVGERLLTQKSFSALFEPNITMSDKAHLAYGLGWMLQDTPLGKVVAHNGNIDGFSSIVIAVPEHDIGVVVLANQDGSPLPNALGNAIVKFMLTPSESAEEVRSFLPSVDTEKRSSESTQRNVFSFSFLEEPSCSDEIPEGVFRHPGYGDLVIIRDGEKLLFKYYSLDGEIRKTPEGFVSYIPVGAAAGEPMATRCVNGRLSLGMPFEPAVGFIWFDTSAGL